VTWLSARLAPTRPLPARRGPATWITGHRHQFLAVLGVVVALLVTVNVLDHVGPARGSLALGPTVALVLLVLARRSGMSWHDLGLGRRTWARGSLVALGSIVAVVAVYAIGIALPLTRPAFLDVRYQLPMGKALFTVLVVIPLSTVLIEEIAFRGVLQGLLTRRRSARWGLGVSSGLFGFWHILPSLNLSHVNAAISRVFGTGTGAQVAAVCGAVAFTAVAGLLLGELRRRSGSIVASAGLHWAVNGVGVLFTAMLFSATRA
jgi:membrane protease YdiL (CAAX protease family)